MTAWSSMQELACPSLEFLGRRTLRVPDGRLDLPRNLLKREKKRSVSVIQGPTTSMMNWPSLFSDAKTSMIDRPGLR